LFSINKILRECSPDESENFRNNGNVFF